MTFYISNPAVIDYATAALNSMPSETGYRSVTASWTSADGELVSITLTAGDMPEDEADND